jgi:hypothetical protein
MNQYDWDDNEFPLAYLITIRTYGTWLHGDDRGSVDRHGQNIYATPRIEPNSSLARMMRDEMKSPPFILNRDQRRLCETFLLFACAER